jgi:MFS family permease
MAVSTTQTADQTGPVETDIPARMDRLPWSRWHWMVVIGLGITWILDGLEVTVVGLVAPVITTGGGGGLDLGTGQIGFANSMYLAGAAAGALILGYLTDKLGRKRLFMFSLLWYLTWTIATAFSFNFESFVFFRFMTGIGIGGEYAAINSAIDELIPARRRGWTDLAINGSWWVGTAIGSAASLYLLNANYVNPEIGWRICFFMGAALALSVLFIRRNLPESPRYLMTHGRFDEADEVVRQIEETVAKETGSDLPEPSGNTIEIDPRRDVGIVGIVRAILFTYPSRSFVGLMLMGSQAFFYNAIFFTYALVLSTFFGISAGDVAYFIFPFAIGNVLGPIVLGHFFDTVGRRPMIFGTYMASAVGLLVTGWMFQQDMLTATTMTICWSITFFFASAGASAAYLTVSEIFPIESRALAIAVFYSIGTLAGGFAAPWLFGQLISTGDRGQVFLGYVVGAALMALGGIAELIWGVEAARKSLEDVAHPISAVRRRVSEKVGTDEGGPAAVTAR